MVPVPCCSTAPVPPPSYHRALRETLRPPVSYLTELYAKHGAFAGGAPDPRAGSAPRTISDGPHVDREGHQGRAKILLTGRHSPLRGLFAGWGVGGERLAIGGGQLPGDGIERLPWRMHRGAVLHPEGIASEAGEDMQVAVEHLLARCPTIGQEQVDALAADPRPAEGPRQWWCDVRN